MYIIVEKFGFALSKKTLGIFLKQPEGNRTKFKYLKKTNETTSHYIE